MQEREEAANVLFWRMRTTIGIVTGLIVFFSSLVFYFSSVRGDYFIELLEETLFIIPLLLASSYLTYELDVKYKKVKAGYSLYIRNSISYLYIVVPFWIMSAVVILSSGKPYLTFIYLNVILSLIITALIINIRVQIWKRISKEIDSPTVLERAKVISERMGIKVSGFRVVDWSKTKIANAFQAGLFRPYIFVSNFLLENLTEDEDMAIIAHELAHAKRKHLKKTLIFAGFDILVIGNTLFVAIVFLLNYGLRLGLAFGIAVSIFVTTYLLLPFLQRRYEKEADLIAASFTDPKLLSDSLLKISRLNNSPLNLPRRLNLSHPSTNERMQYLKEMENERDKEANDMCI